MSFALLIPVGANLANDYFDFVKGADGPERIGPARAVASGLIAPRMMLIVMTCVLISAFILGLTLLPYGGTLLLIVGLLSVTFAVGYTGGPLPLAYLGLGDIFVVAFFGLVAVCFTFYVQAGVINTDAMLLGLAVGLVINNLLVVNNYRDVEEDYRSGKKTLTVRFGRAFSLWQFVLQTLGAGVCTFWVSSLNKLFCFLPTILLGIMCLFVVHNLSKATKRSDYSTCLSISACMVPTFGLFLCIGVLV